MDDSIIMHATVNADRDLHSGVFDVDDTSFLPKVSARYHVNNHRGLPIYHRSTHIVLAIVKSCVTTKSLELRGSRPEIRPLNHVS